MRFAVKAEITVDLGDFERDLVHEYGDEYDPAMLMPMAAQWAREQVEGLENGDDIADVRAISERPAVTASSATSTVGRDELRRLIEGALVDWNSPRHLASTEPQKCVEAVLSALAPLVAERDRLREALERLQRATAEFVADKNGSVAVAQALHATRAALSAFSDSGETPANDGK